MSWVQFLQGVYKFLCIIDFNFYPFLIGLYLFVLLSQKKFTRMAYFTFSYLNCIEKLKLFLITL